MWRAFWKASLVSLAAYTVAVLLGIWMGFAVTLSVIPLFQVTWGLFCIIRIVQLRRATAEGDRESYGFSLGGLISSGVLLLALVVATQAV